MRDKTHDEQIERWARYVRENPESWKKEHTDFIDSQIINSWKFFDRLSKTPNGLEKIKELIELKISGKMFKRN